MVGSIRPQLKLDRTNHCSKRRPRPSLLRAERSIRIRRRNNDESSKDRDEVYRQAVALRPMTLEEAIKEAHFRDRDVFVFRDPKGKVMVLHRTRDGKMELIEAP